jgi:hypothetical protein
MMKHVGYVKRFVCMMTTLQVLGCVSVQAADRLERRSGHPYLTYSDANIKTLKERIANEPAIAEAWERMLANANTAIEPSSGEGDSRRRRRGGGGNELLCLAYRMTGDKRFGERVKQSLFSYKFLTHGADASDQIHHRHHACPGR